MLPHCNLTWNPQVSTHGCAHKSKAPKQYMTATTKYGDYNFIGGPAYDIDELINFRNGYKVYKYPFFYYEEAITKDFSEAGCKFPRPKEVGLGLALIMPAAFQICNCSTCTIPNFHWMLDSGASAHVTPHINNFINYSDVTPYPINIASGRSSLQVRGLGTVQILHMFEDKGNMQRETLHVKDILYVLGVITWILSLGQFLKEGWLAYGS